MKKLSIIGCGKVGKTLGRLWNRAQVFEVRQIIDLSREKALEGVRFVGTGSAGVIDELESADVLLLAVNDDALEGLAAEIAERRRKKFPTIVFHVSGAKSSQILRREFGSTVAVASFHPAKTFAAPEKAIETFSGTACNYEGDEAAIEVLRPAFEAIGGECFAISAEGKSLYHAGLVLGCGSLTALVSLAEQSLLSSGLPSSAVRKILQPLMSETLQNVFEMGAAQALTGPIPRGDGLIVKEHLRVLEKLSGDHAATYRALGRVALGIAQEREDFPADALSSIGNLLT